MKTVDGFELADRDKVYLYPLHFTLDKHPPVIKMATFKKDHMSNGYYSVDAVVFDKFLGRDPTHYALYKDKNKCISAYIKALKLHRKALVVATDKVDRLIVKLGKD